MKAVCVHVMSLSVRHMLDEYKLTTRSMCVCVYGSSLYVNTGDLGEDGYARWMW